MAIAADLPPEWLLPPSLREAAAIQKTMAAKVLLQDTGVAPRIIAGMDVSNNPYDPAQLIYASIVLLDAATLQIIETANAVQKQRFPYVSGFLGFREAPALIEAFEQLTQKPDLIFVDGHGISHPRGLGIASHIGVLLDCPTIGVAKNILVGKPDADLAANVGAQSALVWQQREIGKLLRSKARCKPLIISTGHRITLQTAVQQVLYFLRGYRLPEPTRQAHLHANIFRKQQMSNKQ